MILSFVYLTQSSRIEIDDELLDAEMLCAMAISTFSLEKDVLLFQLPNFILLKNNSLVGINYKSPLYVITISDCISLSFDILNCCTKAITNKPFLQFMKNHCCETCYNTCKEVSCNVCVELKTCQCSQNFCLFSERTQQFSEEEIESFIAKNYSKIALVVFKNYVKSRKLDLILQILSYVEKTNIYEQPNNQAKVLTIVPYQTFNITLEQIREHKLDIEEMQLIVKWFKNTFFHWVEDHCLNCGSKSLRRENGVPNQQEEQHMAGRVEVMICNSCKTIRRFPRYNDPVKLLETRVGRCGEYANCFTFICRSLGYTARLVLDTTDHVWTEFYSRNEQRYVCVDPAEGKVDFPMTYERGWGKKLQYCFGINAHEVVDVTKRYTERYNEFWMH
ncbi:N-glycanase 1 [Entamoeba marina]